MAFENNRINFPTVEYNTNHREKIQCSFLSPVVLLSFAETTNQNQEESLFTVNHTLLRDAHTLPPLSLYHQAQVCQYAAAVLLVEKLVQNFRPQFFLRTPTAALTKRQSCLFELSTSVLFWILKCWQPFGHFTVKVVTYMLQGPLH